MQKKTPSPRKVRKSLNKLGSNPDQVADKLRKLGIKGERGSEASCPIARYLKLKFGINYGVAVRRDTITILDTFVTNPHVITEFISLHDSGNYPELVA